MKTMLAFLLLATTTACVPYYDPCVPKTCNPQVEYCRCVEMDRPERDRDVSSPVVPDEPDYNGSSSEDYDSFSTDNGGMSNT